MAHRRRSEEMIFLADFFGLMTTYYYLVLHPTVIFQCFTRDSMFFPGNDGMGYSASKTFFFEIWK